MTLARVLGACAAICIALAFVLLRAHEPPGTAVRDFGVFYEGGRAFLEHRDAYAPTVLGMPFVSMPQTLPLFALFALSSYDAGVILWTAFLALSCAALVLSMRRIMRLSIEQTAYAALLLSAFVPLTSNFALGQSALPAYAVALIAISFTGAPLARTAAILLTSLQPSAGLGVLSLAGFAKGRILLIGGALLIYVAGTLVDGPIWFVHFARVASEATVSERTDIIQYTPFSVLYGFGMPVAVVPIISWTIAASSAAIAIVGCVRTRSTLHRFAIIGCATVFFSGFFHEHNFIVFTIPTVLCPLYAPKRLVPLALVSAALVSVHWLNFAQRPQEAPQDITLAIAFVCASGALAKLSARSFLATAVPTLAIVTLGAWVGAHNPAPSWNGAGSLHVMATNASELWKQEQLQVGLLDPNAAAAFLRSLALIGSAMLFYVTLNIDVHEVVERRDRIGMEVF
jgi:hypothetical protein